MKNPNVIRMATLLYCETEGIKKKCTILRKVIESVFKELENIELNISELQEQIQSILNIYVSNDELNEVLEKGRTRNYFIRTSSDTEIKYRLDPKRYQRLSETRQKNIEEYINDFITQYDYDNTIKDILYKYIYFLFKRNIVDYSKILGGKILVEENLEQDFTSDDLNYIKQFIEWDNPEKNEAILALMGCSLEYSMLVSNTDYLYGTRLGNIFSNKILYIDTNIIYYCLGVNGEDYKKANEMVLDKCKIAKQQLRITEATETEFTNTLKHYVEEIKKYESGLVKRIYCKYIKNKDVYLFYLEWKKTRKKYDTPEYFQRYMINQYAEWIKRYKVFVDRNAPYDKEDQIATETITTYSEEIPYKGSINYDAINMYWIECLRKKEGLVSGFSEEQYFILSPHKSLKKWDYDRKPTVPTIVSPELWMMLLTRFVTRSDNDYKSFINFINIKAPEEDRINNKEFFVILQAVEEITDDIEQQNSIIDVLVEEKFSYLDKENNSDITLDEIHDLTQEKGRKILSNRIDTLEHTVTQLNETITNIEETSRIQASSYELQLESAITEERKKAAELFAKDKLFRNNILLVLSIICLTGIVIWQIIDFFILKNCNNLFWNITCKLVAQTPLADETNNIFIGLGGLICSVCVGTFDVWAIKRLINTDHKAQRKDKLIKDYERKYNCKSN